MDVSKSASVDSRHVRAKGLRKRWPIAVLVAILVIVGAAAILAARGAFGNMMNTSSLSKTAFDGITVGGQVEVVFEITSMPSDKQLVGNLLESAFNSAYHRTSETLMITVAPDTSVVMGQIAEVKPGAVIQIRGQRTDEHSVTAQRIVILTSYVTVQ